MCPSLSACGSVSFENNLLSDLFWSYFLNIVLPLLISTDSPPPPLKCIIWSQVGFFGTFVSSGCHAV